MQAGGYAQYRTVTTQTSSPAHLLIQLFQASVRNCSQATEAIKRTDVPAAHHHIVRVQDIVLELQRTLDHEKGGEIAAELDKLYHFMYRHLLTANINKDAQQVNEIADLLRQLLQAFQVAASQEAAAVRLSQPTLVPSPALGAMSA